MWNSLEKNSTKASWPFDQSPPRVRDRELPAADPARSNRGGEDGGGITTNHHATAPDHRNPDLRTDGDDRPAADAGIHEPFQIAFSLSRGTHDRSQNQNTKMSTDNSTNSHRPADLPAELPDPPAPPQGCWWKCRGWAWRHSPCQSANYHAKSKTWASGHLSVDGLSLIHI